MAIRPVFSTIPMPPYYLETSVTFTWFPGFAKSQKQKSLRSFHRSAEASMGLDRMLEVSSHSDSELGSSLSAFNLRVENAQERLITMEAAFQGSKVFQCAGQISAAYHLRPQDAKTLARETDANDTLVGFRWQEREWPLEPKTWFYDWLYINAVVQTLPRALDTLRSYEGFTDIEFNPKRSFNCQARSCAIIASTTSDGEIEQFLHYPELMVGGSARPADDQLSQAQLF